MSLHPGFDWNILVIYRHTSALKGFRSGGAYLASHRPGILRSGGAYLVSHRPGILCSGGDAQEEHI